LNWPELPPLAALRHCAHTARGLALSTALSFTSLAVAAQPQAVDAPRLQGTFVQLLSKHGNWSRAEWERLFDCFQALRLSLVVVQWSVYDDIAFFPSPAHQTVPNPPLETILQLAEQHGMQVMVGLSSRSDYWQRIGRDAAQTQAYLGTLLQRAADTAVRAAPLAARYRSFAGWYLSEEVDDLNWQEPRARKALFQYLNTLGSRLRSITPEARVAISGFANAQTHPQAIEAFWNELLLRAPALDLVLFQDGVGAGKLQLEQVAAYLDAVGNAARVNKRELRTVVEVFRQTSGPPLTQGPFEAVPASLESIQRQLELAAAHSSGNLAFGIPEHLCPLGGPQAAQLYEGYVDELRKAK
jgi:Domain of unknown function (DUF4434)